MKPQAVFAKRMSKAKVSAIIQIADKVNQLKKAGEDVISFSIGVPNFLPAEHVYQAAHDAIDHDTGSYLPGRGSQELLDSFTKRMAEDHNLHYTDKEVVAVIGGKHALFNILMATINPGDEVIIPQPYWTSYPDMVDILDGEKVFLPCPAEQNYKLTPEQLDKAITEKTKVFIFNNPSNPTGMVYTKDEIKALGDVLDKHPHLWIISDDIYSRMVFDGEFHHLLHTHPHLKERLAMVHSVSKNYGMPGWRVGLVAATESLVKHIISLNSAQITNLNNISMAAGAAAYGGDQSFSAEAAADFKIKRDKVYNTLSGIAGITCPKPDGAFYAFPDVSAYYGLTHDGQELTDDMAFCTALLEKQKLAVVPGSAFGEPRGLRISYACPHDQLEEGLKRFTAFLADIRAQNPQDELKK